MATVAESFQTHFGEEPTFTRSAAGRINLLGEHTDHAEGLALPGAIQLRVRGAFSPTDDGRITLISAQSPEEASLFFGTPASSLSGWARYVAAAAEVLVPVLEARGKKPRGMKGVIDSDLPLGSGLSSSAALELVVLTALATAAGTELDTLEVAELAQGAEWKVGVKCGLLDPLGIAEGRAGHVSLLDARARTCTPIPASLGEDRLLIAFTKERALLGSEYDTRRAQVEQAATLLRGLTGDSQLKTLRDVSPMRLQGFDGNLSPVLRARSRHVVTENSRVEEAVSALRQGDLATLKRLMRETHASLKTDFEVSTPELDAVVDAAAEFSEKNGTDVGARMMGGGFGGPVLLLLPEAQVAPFRAFANGKYRVQTGAALRFFEVTLEDGLGA